MAVFMHHVEPNSLIQFLKVGMMATQCWCIMTINVVVRHHAVLKMLKDDGVRGDCIRHSVDNQCRGDCVATV